MKQNQFLYLSAEDVRNNISMNDAISAMKEAFIELYSGEAIVPLRIHTEIKKHDATALFMPVYLNGCSKIALKFVTVNNGNPQKGLPLIHAMVMVADAETGKPLGLMDGASITAIRTGAVSGLATDLLARRDSETAAIFGAGIQGRTQLEAICCVRPIKKVYVFDLNPENGERFASEMSQQLSIQVMYSANAADLKEADVICTATTSEKAVFNHNDLKKGAHINAVGAYKPTMQEIPVDTVKGSKIIVDEKEGALSEAGDLIKAIEAGEITEQNIHAEIGQLASGHTPGRETDDEITFFKSVGNAVQDLAAAALVLAGAEKSKAGVILNL